MAGDRDLTAALSAADRRELAAVLIQAAADLFDPPEEPTELPNVNRQAAAAQLGRWLARLPGAAANWDNLLTWPENVPR